jgi:DNA polymerase V
MQQKREQKENISYSLFLLLANLLIMIMTLFTLLLPIQRPQLLAIPLFSGKVSAGFPSPADDYVEKNLDLNELLVQKPAATFFVRAQGDSMLGAGIHPNDILVVDRSIEAVTGKVVICALNGELTVKRLVRVNEQWQLKAENSDYPDMVIYEELDMVIWGVVTNVIHAL